jgi:probable HAF family extracellular repeat protein
VLASFDTSLHILAALPGVPNLGHGLNNQDKVVGTYKVPPDNLSGNGFIWEAGYTTDIGNVPGDVYNQPLAINDSGLVVGGSYRPGAATSRGYVYDGSYTPIEPPAGYNELSATDINVAGDIVGGFSVGNTANGHAFLFKNGILNDLGVLPGTTVSFANSINDFGIVVGVSERPTKVT